MTHSPALESYRTSATESRGRAAFEDKLISSPSKGGISLVEDLAVDDCNDSELPKVLSTFSLLGL